MPGHLFTFHAYGTWMPDRVEGSYHWKRGYRPQNEGLGASYRAKLHEPPAHFDGDAQRVLIEAVLETAAFKRITVHAVATEDTHLHVICKWDDDREPQQLQDRLKHALTQRLNERIRRRRWFSKGGKPELIEDVDHLDHLCDEYLPEHRGLRWDSRRGWC